MVDVVTIGLGLVALLLLGVAGVMKRSKGSDTLSGDPLISLHDDVPIDEKEEQPEVGNNWEYTVEPIETEEKGGFDMKMIADNDGETDVYAGRKVREEFEKHRNNDDEYLWLGYNETVKRGIEPVGIPFNSLFKHNSFFGTSGYGKSTVMGNMMVQLIMGGHGLFFIDPKGEDWDKILQTIPEERHDDVVYVQPFSPTGTVGFNILDSLPTDNESRKRMDAKKAASQITTLLDAQTREWSPELTFVLEAIIEKMILADEDYTLVDVNEVLQDQEEQDKFIEVFSEELDDMEKDYISNITDNQLSSVLSEFETLASKSGLKEVTSNKQCDINFSEAIEDGKIILLDGSKIQEDDLKLLVGLLFRRLWATIQSRKEIPKEERSPFFVFIDELHQLTKFRKDEENILDIGSVLALARSQRLSVTLATQQPSQLPEDINEEVQKNTDNLFSFNPGGSQDATVIAEGMGDIRSWALTDLAQFVLLGRVTIEETKSDPLYINTFPPYPPRYTTEEVEGMIDEMKEKYYQNSLPHDDEEDENIGVKEKDVSETDDEETVIIDTEDGKLSEEHVATAISIARSKDNEPGASKQDIRSIIEQSHPSVSIERIVDEVIQPRIDTVFSHYSTQGKHYYDLEKPIKEIAYQDWDDDEFKLNKKIISWLFNIGYLPFLPSSNYDRTFFTAFFNPPIDPVSQAESFEEAEKLVTILKQQHAELYDLFEDKRLALHPVINAEQKPERVATALSSSGDKHLIIATKAENKEQLEEVIGNTDSERFVKQTTEEKQILYETQSKLTTSDGKIPVVKSKDTYWEIKNRKIKLKDNDDNEICSTSEKGIENGMDELYSGLPDTLFRYTAEEQEDGSIDILNEDQEIIESYSSEEQAEKRGYNLINRPFIPNSIIPGKEQYFTKDDYTVVTVDQNDEITVIQ